MMRRAMTTTTLIGVLGWGIVATGVSLAQATEGAPPENWGPFRIAGVLENAATGEPIRRATIEVLRDQDAHAVATCITDNDGRFGLDHLGAAKYELSATKRGFRGAFYDEHDGFSSAIVTGPGQDTTHLLFKLVPSAILHGLITSDDGDPVAGARVMLFRRPKHPWNGQRMGPGETALTDDTGAYELSNLASGEYFLAVMADPWYAVHEGAPNKRNAALDVVYPVTYFDSTTDEASATPITLAGGSRQEANISLHAVPALHVTISVARKPNGSIAQPELQQTIFGTTVSAQSAGFLDALRTGSVEMDGIAPGHYQLTQGQPQRVIDLDLSASQQVDPAAGTPANAVSGRLMMSSEEPPPDDATVSLERVDNNPGQYIFGTVAHHGQFSFEAVPPGEWAVSTTSGNRAIPVVSVSAGGARRSGNIVSIREHTPDLAVTLTDSETDLEGFAKKNGKGFAGAMVVLLPRSPAQWRALTRRDQTDSDGSFALHNVVPGAYTLIAIADGWELDWTSPLAMARYLSGGTNVRVTESPGKLVQLSTPVAVEER